MRFIRKQWKDRRSGWSNRITWYDDGGTDIRLQLETPDGKRNVHPRSESEAQRIWAEFKEKPSFVFVSRFK